MRKEIGGYLELERFTGPMLHDGALALSSGRACLSYLIEQRGIRKIALPDYNWNVEFDGNKSFVRLDRSSPRYDTANLKSLGDGMYEIAGDVPENAVKYIRHEEVSAKTILDVKSLIEKEYGEMPVVLYHLDSVQLSKYDNDEIKAFFD